MGEPSAFKYTERERDGVGEGGREVRFGWQPGTESGLPRCGSSGYPLASVHINDHGSHMAVQSIWVKWPRCALQTLTHRHTINPYLVTELLLSVHCTQSNKSKIVTVFCFVFLQTDINALQLGPGLTMLSKR